MGKGWRNNRSRRVVIHRFLVWSTLSAGGGGLKWFLFFTSKLGEDEPILTQIFSNLVAQTPPRRPCEDIYLNCTQLAISGQGMSLSRIWGEIRWTRSSQIYIAGTFFRCFYCIWLQIISSSVVKQWQKLHMKHSNDIYGEDHGGIHNFWYWSVSMFVFFLEEIKFNICALIGSSLSFPGSLPSRNPMKKEHWSLFW